jgi:hypothetical protein
MGILFLFRVVCWVGGVVKPGPLIFRQVNSIENSRFKDDSKIQDSKIQPSINDPCKIESRFNRTPLTTTYTQPQCSFVGTSRRTILPTWMMFDSGRCAMGSAEAITEQRCISSSYPLRRYLPTRLGTYLLLSNIMELLLCNRPWSSTSTTSLPSAPRHYYRSTMYQVLPSQLTRNELTSVPAFLWHGLLI